MADKSSGQIFRAVEVPQQISEAWVAVHKAMDDTKGYTPNEVWKNLKAEAEKGNKVIGYGIAFVEKYADTNKKYSDLKKLNEKNKTELRKLLAERVELQQYSADADVKLRAMDWIRADKALRKNGKQINKIRDDVEEEYGFKVHFLNCVLEQISRYPESEKSSAEEEARELIKTAGARRYLFLPPKYEVIASPNAIRKEVQDLLNENSNMKHLNEQKIKVEEEIAHLYGAEKELVETINVALLKVLPPERKSMILAFFAGELEDLKLDKATKQAMKEFVKGERPEKLEELIRQGLAKRYDSLEDQLKEIRTKIREKKAERADVLKDLKDIINKSEYSYGLGKGGLHLSSIYEANSKDLTTSERKRMNELKGLISDLSQKTFMTKDKELESTLYKYKEEYSNLKDRDDNWFRNAKLAKDLEVRGNERINQIKTMKPTTLGAHVNVYLSANMEPSTAAGQTGYTTIGNLGATAEWVYGSYSSSFFVNFGLGKQKDISNWGTAFRRKNTSLMYSSSASTKNYTLYFGPMPYSMLQERGVFPLTGAKFEDLVKPSGYLDFSKGDKTSKGLLSIRWPWDLGMNWDDDKVVPRVQYSAVDFRSRETETTGTLGVLHRMGKEGAVEVGIGKIIRIERGKDRAYGSEFYINGYGTPIQGLGLKTLFNVSIRRRKIAGEPEEYYAQVGIAKLK